MISKEMTIGEVLQMDRGVAPIFMRIGMHCLGCPHSAMESVEQAAAVHGVDVDKLVEELNAYFAEKA